MNEDAKNGVQDLTVVINGDVNVKGAFTMPQKGYQSLTITGNNRSITFTGNIKLTGNTTMSELTLYKVNNKGKRVSGKVIKGKYSYSGPDSF